MAGTAAVGTTTRYASGTATFNNGTDAFRYTPATGTVQIGLVGGIYTNGVRRKHHADPHQHGRADRRHQR